MEILVPNAAIRNLIREDKIHQIYSAMQTGQDKFGMQTFNQSLATAYFQKQITLETGDGAFQQPGRIAGNDQPRRELVEPSRAPAAPHGQGRGSGEAVSDRELVPAIRTEVSDCRELRCEAVGRQ